MFDEEDFLPISALSQLAYCERRCALMHIEGIWEENRFTAEGRNLHDHAHESGTESRVDVRITRGLRLRSLRLGLTGKADVVEFHRLPEQSVGPASLPGSETSGLVRDSPRNGVSLEGVPGLWLPFPVEYKRGHPKPDHSDEVQLCAQALCLEEMLKTEIPSGALYYGEPRRRYDVVLSRELRDETESLASKLHELNSAGRTPSARWGKKCKNCSLVSLCMPVATDGGKSARRYLDRAFKEMDDL